MGHVEIHFHLLPGLDDGPTSLSDCVALAAAAAQEGTRTIVATPHVNATCTPGVGALAELVEEVRAALGSHGVPVSVRCGAELAVERARDLSEEELDLIAQGPSGRRWVLLEAPLDGLTDDFSDTADSLRDRGLAVVVAHPERSITDREVGWRVLEHELAAGSGLQVNAWSVTGRYGERVRREALRVLARTPRAVIASDAHGRARMPALSAAVPALRAAGDRDALRRVGEWPRALLEGGLAARPTLAA